MAAIKYWREAIIALLIAVIGVLVMVVLGKNVKIANTENERDQYKSALDYQNDTLLREGEKYEARLKQLPTEIEKITTRYVAVYNDIETWKGDENASDCDNAHAFLTGFNY